MYLIFVCWEQSFWFSLSAQKPTGAGFALEQNSICPQSGNLCSNSPKKVFKELAFCKDIPDNLPVTTETPCAKSAFTCGTVQTWLFVLFWRKAVA